MKPFIIEENLAEPTFAHALLLDGAVEDVYTLAAQAEVHWRFEDDPAMEPQFLGRQTAGHTLSVPFDLQGRAIRLYAVSVTKDASRSVSNIKQAEQKVFYPPDIPVLISATFDAGTDDVTLNFTGNGGGGTIHILRQLGTGEFAEIATVAFDATNYIDSPAIDGTYSYKLTQDNVIGESNAISVVVDVDAAGAGSPPSGLSAVYDGVITVDLSWTNNGGTGNNIIEQKWGSNPWAVVGSEIASATASTDTVPNELPYNIVYFYRVKNESASGYSNTDSIYVPRLS